MYVDLFFLGGGIIFVSGIKKLSGYIFILYVWQLLVKQWWHDADIGSNKISAMGQVAATFY